MNLNALAPLFLDSLLKFLFGLLMNIIILIREPLLIKQTNIYIYLLIFGFRVKFVELQSLLIQDFGLINRSFWP